MTGVNRPDSQALHRRARVMRSQLAWRLARLAIRGLRRLLWHRPSQRWIWQTIG